MNLNFIVTGKDFGYLYYLAVLSALKTQHVSSTTIWTTERVDSIYLDELKNKVYIRKIECPKFPALYGKPDYFVKAHTKDYLTYKILYENGGVCLDLDTISIGDITELLDDKELVVPSDAEKPDEFLYHFNSAILVAKKKSPLLLEAMQTAYQKLNSAEEFPWGTTGPILISNIVFKNEDKVVVPEFRVCGGFRGYEIVDIYKEDNQLILDSKIKVIHLFAVVSNRNGNLFDNVNPLWIKNSNSLLARTVKSILNENEWNPMPKFFVEIGSNYFDTLVSLANSGWKGLVVEPVPEYFNKIQKVGGIYYENVAVGNETKIVPFYYIPQETINSKKLPEWARGLGSINKNHPIVISNGWENLVKEISIQMMTVKDLLDKYGIKKIDYLKIDTEGMDCEILNEFDISDIQEILFEHKHCLQDDVSRELQRLQENNFTYKLEGDNVRAVKNSSVSELEKSTEWEKATGWESAWWGNCLNTLGEEFKQVVYCKKMGLPDFEDNGHPFTHKLDAETVLDIGGGPSSILLKCTGYKKGTVIDPCHYPNWVHVRYKEAGIEYLVQKAEDLDITKKYDLVLIYNVLQHTEDPEKIIKNALLISKEIRIFEWIDIPISPGHIHMLTENILDSWLGGVGKTEKLDGTGGCIGMSYFGIFKGKYFNG